MQRLICTTLFLISVVSLASADDTRHRPRFWTDNTGDFTVRATLVERTSDAVTLRLSNGSQIRVGSNRLSSTDHAWLEQKARTNVSKPVALADVQWFRNFKDAQRAATGSSNKRDSKPILCFRALGDLCGFM
ncbi:MAG: SHD1 domain-containing protein [Planctomycetaceae bacterium]